MFKQYIKQKNITALLTLTSNTGSSYSKKIIHKSSIGLGPTDTILIRNLKTIGIYFMLWWCIVVTNLLVMTSSHTDGGSSSVSGRRRCQLSTSLTADCNGSLLLQPANVT